MIYRLIIFTLLNFGALAIGSLFTSKGVPSDWYQNLNKAPWTPPGWSFGLAWTTIMVCFSIYMAYLWPLKENKSLIVGLFAVQWLLNVSWNPTFFYFHNSPLGLLIILALTLLIGYIGLLYYNQMGLKSLLILPYALWLIIASSLNAYIVLKN